MQVNFARDVQSLVKVIQKLGNPFEEESRDIIILDSKEIADPSSLKTVQNVHQIGQNQFKALTMYRLVERTKSPYNPISHNKLNTH